MSDDQGDRDPHAAPSNLGWPLVTLGIALLAAITIISVTGGDLKGLNDTLGLLLGVVGAGGGVGAWVNSTRAARQTNGALDKRMDAAVQRGLARALDDARKPARPGVREPVRPKRPH